MPRDHLVILQNKENSHITLEDTKDTLCLVAQKLFKPVTMAVLEFLQWSLELVIINFYVMFVSKLSTIMINYNHSICFISVRESLS